MSNARATTRWRGWRQWWRGERGMSEAATAIFVLPIIASMVFLMVEAGVNIHYRMAVDNIAQDAVRGAALDGGNNFARTNMTGKAWSARAVESLNDLCGGNRCTKPPTATCTPATANRAGDPITCTVVFHYKAVSPLTNSEVFSLGLKGALTAPISTTVSSVAATGRNG